MAYDGYLREQRMKSTTHGLTTTSVYLDSSLLSRTADTVNSAAHITTGLLGILLGAISIFLLYIVLHVNLGRLKDASKGKLRPRNPWSRARRPNTSGGRN
eukprot:GHVS01035337.1.p1 GENE.GHVS01035337.1~~GHVS01035337.1.p1  ORF type:complete len:100 (+),score=2.30 GHVS01035337.1:2-301(+)